MPRAFADITFTDSVKAAQDRYGSRDFNLRFEASPDRRDRITSTDADFIARRDSFYQATVGENGWPYMQHRGGPVGVLKVLDEQHLGYADFRGNRQYLSVGNLSHDERICLFLMDYVNRARLKIWGRATIVHEPQEPALIASLQDATYKAPVERAVIIAVEALEWNCSKHITQRFTEAQIQVAIAPLLEENEQLKARLAALTDQQ